MTDLKNTWTTEEGEAIMDYIIKGDSVEEAKAKVMSKKDEKLSKAMAELYVPNVMKTDRAEAYGKLTDDMVNNRKAMIELFGEDNFTAYNIAGKKNKVEALITGVNKNRNQGFKLKNSKGCYGIEA